MKRRYSASVRAVVEYALMGGDLTAAGSIRKMREGTAGHLARQGALEGAQIEYPLRVQIETERCELLVSGRIDALYERGGVPVIEEIKLFSGEEREAPLPAHRAQAVVYAYMLNVPAAVVRVAYVRADGQEIAAFEELMTRGEICRAFFSLLMPYVEKIEREAAWRAVRDESLAALQFPYGAWRGEQRKMAVQVYCAIRARKRLFAQAPTGTGKTAAALFPALKALGEGLTEQVYYLTARTTGRETARDMLALMREKGARLRALTLTAKEKCCPFAGAEEWRCEMSECPRAKGFFDRLPQGLDMMREGEDWSYERIQAVAETHCLCPFELSLSLCEEADAVVCDYNYAFDPSVRIKRIFQGAARVTLLTDEAHNLPDRARDMLSAELDGGELREGRRLAGKTCGRKSELYLTLTKLIACVETAREAASEAPPEELQPLVERALDAALETGAEGTARVSRKLLAVLMALRRYDAAFRTFWTAHGKTAALSLRCLDAAEHLAACTKRLCGSAFFSATMTPLAVYRRMLGGAEDDALLSLPSPFPQGNLLILRSPLSTRYRDRNRTAEAVADAILALAQARSGCCLACFPSYAYLQQAAELISARKRAETELILQREGMSEAERGEFLRAFSPRESGSLLALAVLGGAFGESVNLPGERLVGVAVVGVGMPQVCPEREALKTLGDKAGGDGFETAYRVPGMSRVTQAVGRLIRSADDRGVALLIDDRFSQEVYQKIMPPWWGGGITARNAEEIERRTKAFWDQGSSR